MSKLTKSEFVEFKKYRKPSTNFNKCKVNEFVVFPNNSYEHERAKFDKYFELRELGHNLLTECEEISTKERCDLVDLSTTERYEIETTIERAARFIGKPVNIIPVGWSFGDNKWKEKCK